MMPYESVTQDMLLGLGGFISIALNGWMAFNRYWIANQAKNANDTQQVDMLARQEKYISRLEKTNQQLRLDISTRDGTIRDYWKIITTTQARLQIIETAQTYLKNQNDGLKEQVIALTASNQQLINQITQLRAALGTTVDPSGRRPETP